jgi:hypothetical protein
MLCVIRCYVLLNVIIRFRKCRRALSYVCWIVTFENYRFRKYVGQSVCLFVCLSTLYRPQFFTDGLDISYIGRYRLTLGAYCFLTKSGQGQGQGHQKREKHILGHNFAPN